VLAVTVIVGDCIEVMRGMEAGSVHAVVTDPPYNIGKAAWDKIPNYLEWCEAWIAEASSICNRQGAFWCFHSEPLVLADIARIIERHGRPLRNWVTWDKYNENGTHSMKGFLDGYTLVNGLRKFQDFAEYIVYHADDGQWMAQSDECWGFIFEPLRAYLAGEWKRAGLNAKDANEACGTASMAGHYFIRSQWCLPTQEHYHRLQKYANAQGGDYLRREYDDLRREYDDLRREYEHLRPTFNNPGRVSSVWQYPPAPANGHATPKPVELMKRIVEATTNPGDTVLDPFMGSGTTGVACISTGRKFIGIELNPDYAKMGEARMSGGKLDPEPVVDGAQMSLFEEGT
jgi:site-specific DNA-methyltransferase (adenine-specific)